jgi:hypothetical protein
LQESNGLGISARTDIERIPIESIPENAFTYACPECYAEGCTPASIKHSPACPRHRDAERLTNMNGAKSEAESVAVTPVCLKELAESEEGFDTY